MKRKLYLITDRCKHDTVFYQNELAILNEEYDVTIVSEDDEDYIGPTQKHVKYNRKMSKLSILKYSFYFLFYKRSWEEITRILKLSDKKIKAILETLRFYINSELFYDFLLKNEILTPDSDAIIYSFWYFWKCFAVTNHRKKYPNIKVIARTHGYDLYKERLASGWQPYKNAMDESLDKLVFVSDYAKDYYFKAFDIKESEKHKLYYLGVKNEYEQKAFNRKEELRIVSCSNVIALKRVDIIVRMLSLIDDIKVTWIHFGDGDRIDATKELASELLDNKENITYEFMGNRDNREILNYYHDNEVDIFVHMSSTEGGNPVAIQEAMSFGIPILASGICNIPNMLEGKGLLVSENPSDDECANKIREYIHMSEEEVLQMRNNMRDIWKRRFNADINSEAFVREIIDKL